MNVKLHITEISRGDKINQSEKHDSYDCDVEYFLERFKDICKSGLIAFIRIHISATREKGDIIDKID